MPDERNTETVFEALKENLWVCRSARHGFGTDAFLLTGFSRYRANDRVCDLGTGCGIIPLLMQRSRPPKEIYAVDIQPDAIAQLEAALARSSVQSVIRPVCADLRLLWEDAPVHSLDLVTCNPPYFKADSGFLSQETGRQKARHETECTVADVCRAAARLLKYRGRLCICGRPERLPDAICAMRENAIEPKRLRMVCKTPEDAPWLYLLEGMTGAKPSLLTEPALFMRSGEGMTTEAAMLCHFGEGYR